MRPYTLSYEFEGRDGGLTLWARDAREAAATGLSIPQLARLQAEAPDYMSPGDAA